MSTLLTNLLSQLKPTGKDGFEGLIAGLLEALTGRHFLIAQSGSQRGRDMSSRYPTANVVAVECKRYDQTELDERSLLGELVQAAEAIPDLDLWVLVTSRNVPSQLEEALRQAARRYGIEYLSISTADGSPSSLETLCAQAPDVVLPYIETLAAKIGLDSRSYLSEITASPGFVDRLKNLRETLSSPLLGYDNWRMKQNELFRQSLRSETESRACFGQVINCADERINLVVRQAAWVQMDQWLAEWTNTHVPLVVLGEEGDGKTWATASWLSHKLQNESQVPCIVFLSSTEVDTNEPRELLIKAISRRLRSIEPEQIGKHLDRWVSASTTEAPLVLLVLDGINERRDHGWWRTLLERLAAVPWFNHVAVLVTCRTAFWNRHFASLHSMQVANFILGPYDGDELNELLAFHNLRASDIQAELLPLIRKPRYFDLMIRYRERIAESGDFTITRLIYEDWHDKLERKVHIPLDDEGFQAAIRDLARKYLDGSKYVSEQDIDSLLSPFADRKRAFEELWTSGILQGGRGHYQVNEYRLIFGFALLIVDHLEEAVIEGRDLAEALDEWLEPHAEMDIKARICGFAALHALSLRDYPQQAKIALLSAWLNSRNPGDDIEEDFGAYLPIDPACYFKLAEQVWSNASEKPWAEDLLMRSFLRWCRLPRVASDLRLAAERWLGLIYPYGFLPMGQPTLEELEQRKEKIRNRLGHELHPGPFTFGNYSLTVIENEGLLRLSRVALALISHLPRSPFVRAMTIGCIAEAIMGHPDKYDLFAWIIHSSSEPLWNGIRVEVGNLLAMQHRVATTAARRLLALEGMREAFQLRQTLSLDQSSVSPWAQRHQEDPCTSGFGWDWEDCAICLFRDDLEPQWIARQVKQHVIDPDLAAPEDLGLRLAPLAQEILVTQISSILAMTEADHALDNYEPALCASAPHALASLVRQICHQLPVRNELPLRLLAGDLREYYLTYTEEEWEEIIAAWERLVSVETPLSEEQQTAEMYLFLLVLKRSQAEDQLRRLVSRPAESIDWLLYEGSFQLTHDWNVVWRLLQNATTENETRRILWFISKNPAAIPPEGLYNHILPLLKHESSLVRAKVLQLVRHSRDRRSIQVVLDSHWAWSAQSNDRENHWGSIFLAEHGTDLPYSDLRVRMHPSYLSYALKCRGTLLDEIQQYAENLQRIWLSLGERAPDLPPDFPPTRIERPYPEGDDIQEVDHYALLETGSSTSVVFLSRHAYWGGLDTAKADSMPRILYQDDEQQDRVLLHIIDESIRQQRQAGNLWFARAFHQSALEQVVEACPNRAQYWLSWMLTTTDEAVRQIKLGQSFCEALCQALLIKAPLDGLALYERLHDVPGRVHYQDVHTTFKLLDYALFRAPDIEEVRHVWKEKLECCLTDRELMEIVILAQRGNGREWLWSYVRDGLQSVVPITRLRSITVLGFIEDVEAYAQLDQMLAGAPDTWIKDLLEKTLLRWKKNEWAKYWFRRFITVEDDILAWASFRLFLRCVDSRFWHWRNRVWEEESNQRSRDERQMFLEDNLDTIKNHLKKNEKELTERLLGHKVLKDQAWPWM